MLRKHTENHTMLQMLKIWNIYLNTVDEFAAVITSVKNCNNAPHYNNCNKQEQPSSSRNCLKYIAKQQNI